MSGIDPVYSPAKPLLSPDGLELSSLEEPIALTGGTGFVGSHLVDTLVAAGFKPRILVRNPESMRWVQTVAAELIPGSLEDVSSLEALVAGAKTVLHLAGSLRAPSAAAFMEGNAGGMSRLIKAIRESSLPAHLVFCSSQAALGPSADLEGVPPEAPLRPISAYGKSKASAERLLRDSGLYWSIVRPPAIFGPRETDILEFFRMASRGVVAYPAGERWVSIACVTDVLRVLLEVACHRAPRSIRHVALDPPIRMDEMLREIAGGSQRSFRMLAIPPWVLRAAGWGGSTLRTVGFSRIPLSRDKVREILARHWVLKDTSEAGGLLRGMPLKEGIALTWEWYRRIGWLPSKR